MGQLWWEQYKLMGFFGKSIKEKILDLALLAINENEPTKDKFLTFYRIC